MNETLDYAAPPKRSGRLSRCAVFFGAWVASVPLTAILDDVIHVQFLGHHGDGGSAVIAALIVVPTAALAALHGVRSLLCAALLGGLCGPAAILVMTGFVLIAEAIH